MCVCLIKQTNVFVGACMGELVPKTVCGNHNCVETLGHGVSHWSVYLLQTG